MPRERPSREEGRTVARLLRDDRTHPDEWTREERSAVTRLHLWAHGAPPNLDRDARERPRGIRVGDPVAPLPSEVLQSVDGGRGIEAFVLSVEVLDRLPVLMRDEVPPGGLLANPDGVARGEAPILAEEEREPWQRPSDGYLDDAETWGEDQQTLVEYARNSGHGVVPTREVLALLRLDRILGNEYALTETGTGRVRGIVSGALRDWHARQRAIAEQLGPVDPTGGPHDEGREVDALRAEVGRLSARLASAEEARDAHRADAERRGRMLDAQQRTTETLREQLDEQRARAERAEGLIEPVELYVPVAARVTWDGSRLRALYLHPHDGTVGSEQYADGKGRPLTIEDVREEGEQPVAPRYPRDLAGPVAVEFGKGGTRVDSIEAPRLLDLGQHPLALRVYGPGLVLFDGRVLRVEYEPAQAIRATTDQTGRPIPASSGRPIEEDPRRPHPNAWPDDAVLLTYRELRRLVVLHLERYEVAPETCRAMLEGELPLRVGEVLA